MALVNFHLVNWKTVGQLIQPWGLGIQSMVCFNQALLVKWLCVLLLKGGNLL